MTQPRNNFKTLWEFMAGQCLRYIGALLAMFLGVGTLYLTPLITRATIDGVITVYPAVDISPLARFLSDRRTAWGPERTLTLAAARALVVASIQSSFSTT